jgi:HK97 family phage portal protein
VGIEWNFFDFLGRKLDTSEFSTVAVKAMEEAAIKELALQIAVSYISNTLSKCEIKTYENGEEVQDEFYYLLNVQPNPNQNASQFINRIVENYVYDNEALVVLHKDHLYCADSFTIDESEPLKGFKYSDICFGMQHLSKDRRANEVFHFKLDNKNIKKQVDLLNAKYGEVVDVAMKAYKATNGRKYKLLLERYQAGDPQFKELYEKVLSAQLKTFIENENAIYPEFKGMSLQEFVAQNRTDTADIIAMRKEIFETTGQAFKIPQSMMYGNMTNIKDVVAVFLTFAIEPVAKMLSAEFTRKRYDFEEWKRGCHVEVDTSCISYADILECADKVDKAISSGVTTIDELRPRFRLKKLDTDFSKAHFITKNYDLAENMLKNLEEREVKENEEVLPTDAER